MEKIFLLFVFGFNFMFSIEIDLNKYERSVFSQNGEDGIIDALFKFFPSESKYYVEFGAMDGHRFSNTKYLREFKGWNGLLMDNMYESKELNLHKEHITTENINQLFRKYDVPYNLDVLSIDIYSNDFYVWKNLDDCYRPKVIIMEYNASLGSDEALVIPYSPNHRFDSSVDFGASIMAYYQLGREKNYSLVYVEKSGLNLIFIRDDIIKNLAVPFKNINCPKKLFRKINSKFGVREDKKKRKFISYKSAMEINTNE